MTASDGRVLRGERNRELIVTAVLELVRSGVSRPTAEEVAERAGVGTRTVFRHFDDMESLHAALRERVTHEVKTLLEPRSFAGGTAERVRELVKVRSRIFEKVGPTRRASLRVWPKSEVIEKGEGLFDERMRAQLFEALGPDLAKADGDLVEALDAALSWEVWDRLRHIQRLGRARAERVLEGNALAILAAAS